MQQDARIYVAGHRGLVGSALVRALQAHGYEQLIYRSSRELDLRDQAQVRTHYQAERPDYVLVYGPEDHFDLAASHVLPALIRKLYEAYSF